MVGKWKIIIKPKVGIDLTTKNNTALCWNVMHCGVGCLLDVFQYHWVICSVQSLGVRGQHWGESEGVTYWEYCKAVILAYDINERSTAPCTDEFDPGNSQKAVDRNGMIDESDLFYPCLWEVLSMHTKSVNTMCRWASVCARVYLFTHCVLRWSVWNQCITDSTFTNKAYLLRQDKRLFGRPIYLSAEICLRGILSFFFFSPSNLQARSTELNENRPHGRK